MFTPRSSGVLLHPTSFPSPYGIGDLGDEAYRFVDWLAEAGQRWWQILPLNPTWADGSPYKSPAALAGNPLLVSPDRLIKLGLLEEAQVSTLRDAGGSRFAHIDFPAVMKLKHQLLMSAFERSRRSGSSAEFKRRFDEFRHKESDWLEPLSMFLALREANGGRNWIEWTELVDHRTKQPTGEAHSRLAERIEFHRFEQFLFDIQWDELRGYARERNIRIIGDIPIYVSDDSADVWGNQHIFLLDAEGRAEEMAGVPPDYFAATGQLWKNPIYNWRVLEERGYDWWLRRIHRTLEQVDVARIDHFRGFEAYWSVPKGEETAIRGEWKDGPREKLFHAIARSLGGDAKSLPLIAEDLGTITPPVVALRKEFGLPGMRVLQFELMDPNESAWRVEHYEPDTAVYTGTHDNDTTLGWFKKEILPHEDRLNRVRSLVKGDLDTIVWDMIDMAWRSSADLAVVPLQDLFGLDSDARMNLPGTEWPQEPNWRWRFHPEHLTSEISHRLRGLTDQHRRRIS